jgi:hypothetical protein
MHDHLLQQGQVHHQLLKHAQYMSSTMEAGQLSACA